MLYRYLLPKAEKIAVRDRDSLAIAKKFNPENTILYQDFAQEIIENSKHKAPTSKQKYIMININKQSVNKENVQRIVDFCIHYPDHKKIFFPCDMKDDKLCFQTIKKYLSDLEMYDRTKHPLTESLSLFYYADGGI